MAWMCQNDDVHAVHDRIDKIDRLARYFRTTRVESYCTTGEPLFTCTCTGHKRRQNHRSRIQSFQTVHNSQSLSKHLSISARHWPNTDCAGHLFFFCFSCRIRFNQLVHGAATPVLLSLCIGLDPLPSLARRHRPSPFPSPFNAPSSPPTTLICASSPRSIANVPRPTVVN